MKKSGLFFIALLLIVAGCQNADKASAPEAVQETQPEVSSYALHAFSHPGKKDSFSIVLTAIDSLLEGNVVFTITSHDGRQIFREEFPARQLLDYSVNYDAPRAEIETFLRNRISTFFIEENFSNPAIDADEPFSHEYANREDWLAVKEDRDAIGFFYVLGPEDGRRIAYVSKWNKVVQYHNCC